MFVRTPEKTQSYQASFQCWANIGTRFKWRFTGEPIIARQKLYLDHLSPNPKKTLSKVDPLWQSFQNPRMQLSTRIVSLSRINVYTGPRSAVGNVSGYRCVSDCRSRGREFGPVPNFRGDWSWNNFYGHSPPFRWFIQEGLLSVTSESLCTNYWLTACSSLQWP